ncbi:MAG: hypothetical protein ABJD68_12975 [Nakamurella sp.]
MTTTIPPPLPKADPTAALTAAVDNAETDGVRESVVVIDRSSGAVLDQLNPHQQFPALSLVKLMIAADILHGSGGRELPDQTLDAELGEMISKSDDDTADDLYAQSGGDEMVHRVVQRYGLAETSPSPETEYWGDVQTTAADMASLIRQILADPVTSPVIGPAMLAATPIADDGFDQQIGMNTIPGAGSKQGWGCCLSGVVGIHSVGFTPDRIVAVLSSAQPDDDSLGDQGGLALQADAGAEVSIAAVTDTAFAALTG